MKVSLSRCAVRCVRSDGLRVYFKGWIVPGIVPEFDISPTWLSLSAARSVASRLMHFYTIVRVVCVYA